MAERRIDILINTKNNNAGIKSAENDLKSLDSAAGGLSGALGALGTVAGVAGIVGIGIAAGGAAVELARSSAEAARTRTAFDNLAADAGESGNQMLEAMRRASGGMVSNADLVASANRAMLLGVASSSEQLSQLLEVASARGKAMGLSTQQAFGDLVTGIGRMSPMILDNLGIVTGGEKVFKQYAESIGTTADKLSDAEKKQALLNAVVSSSQGMIANNAAAGEDLASKFERMDAALANAKDALGQLFAPAVAAVAQQLADAVDTVVQKSSEMGQARVEFLASEDVEATRQKIEGVTRAIEDMKKNMELVPKGSEQWNNGVAGLAQLEAELKKYQSELVQAKQHQEDVTGATANFKTQINALAGAFPTYNAQVAQSAANERQAAAETRQLQASLSTARAAYEQFGDAAANAGRLAAASAYNIASAQRAAIRGAAAGLVDSRGAQGAIDFANEQTRALTSQVEQWQAAGFSIDEINQTLIPNFISGINDSVAAATKLPDAIASSAEDAFNSLKGKVSGVLGEALSADVGVNPDDILPRTDAINENARRLADIAVNGYKSPWLAYFQQEFPSLYQQFFSGAAGDDGIKQNAAQLIKNFQDGLEPELLDKEAAKDKVRRMLVGEQNMNALAQEIAQELSGEFGNVAPTDIAALAQDALGGGKLGKGDNAGGGAGSALAAGLAEGLTGAGDKAIASLAAELKNENNLKLITDAGRSGGGAWGNGFMETVGANIPQRLLDLLATLITPMVQGNLSQQAALQGAK